MLYSNHFEIMEITQIYIENCKFQIFNYIETNKTYFLSIRNYKICYTAANEKWYSRNIFTENFGNPVQLHSKCIKLRTEYHKRMWAHWLVWNSIFLGLCTLRNQWNSHTSFGDNSISTVFLSQSRVDRFPLFSFETTLYVKKWST